MGTDRLIIHTVHTDSGATEVYFGRANDDHIVTFVGSLLFHKGSGGFTYKMWTDSVVDGQDEIPLILHVDGNSRIRVTASEDQPPGYEDDSVNDPDVLFDSAKLAYASDDNRSPIIRKEN